MIRAEDFYAKPGEPIRPRLIALAKFIAGDARTVSGAGIRRHQSKTGTTIVADFRPPPFGGFFGVAVLDDKATVSFGTVNTIVPTINDVPIDGIDDKGKAGEIPTLKIEGTPTAEHRSWVAVRAVPSEDEEAASNGFVFEMTHTNDASLFQGNSDDDGAGHFPVAMLIWSEDNETLRQVRRVHYFCLQHSYDEATEKHVWK